MNKNGDLGIHVPDYVDENVSNKARLSSLTQTL